MCCKKYNTSCTVLNPCLIIFKAKGLYVCLVHNASKSAATKREREQYLVFTHEGSHTDTSVGELQGNMFKGGQLTSVRKLDM
jgi:hypothetical protein